MLRKLFLSLASAGLFLVSHAAADTLLTESFSNNPAADGWQIFGATNLFTWDAANHDLQVTWDSTQSNSYFFHSLGTILTSNDDFSVSFDLLLNDANTNADGTNALQLAIGFNNLAEAENTNFLAGAETVTNLAEFEFFPGTGEYAGLPSLDATLVDSNADYFFAYADGPWNFGVFYHVTLSHAAGTSSLTGQILTNGQIYLDLPPTPGNVYGVTGDFRLNTVSVSSYSDLGSAALGYPSSITAHGIVKNIVVTGPPPPVTYLSGSLTNNSWQTQFSSRINWNYTLEKSADLQTWSPLAPTVAGTGGLMILQDPNALQQSQYYRVSANPQ